MKYREKLKAYKFSNNLIGVLRKLKNNGFEAYLVGGAVRNILLSISVTDFDITTNATPLQVKSIFKKVIDTGIKHGTVTVILKNESFEVTTYRKDGKYKDFRRPEKIEYSDTLDKDLERRDFTVNALCYDPLTEEFVDLFNGIKHIEEKIIVAINNPVERFNEDALRMMRAIRFGVQLNFKIDESILRAIELLNENIKNISTERIKEEFDKILLSDFPAKGIRLLEKSGLLKHFLPELSACKGVEQNKYHIYDVYEHILHALDNSKRDLTIRLAVLFHDIAKPEVREEINGKVTFYNHEIEGAELVKNILKRLKYPNDIVKKVSRLVRYHMFNYTKNWKDSAVRRFVNKVGKEYIDMLYEVRKADASAGNPEYKDDSYEELFERVKKIITKEDVFSIKDLKINGNDVMKVLKMEPSRKVGEILKEVFDFVMENPENNKRDILLKYIKEHYG